MAIDMDLAKRLKVYRNFKHLTQKEVASHLNVPHSAISDIENGKRDVTVSELKILSHLYGRTGSPRHVPVLRLRRPAV